MTELGVVGPHAVHNHRELSGDRDDGAAAAFSAHQAQAPAFDLGAGDGSHHHRVRSTVERRTHIPVACRDWLPSTGLKYKAGAGPWVLIYVGDDVGKVVQDLAENHGILVQDQSGKAVDLNGWIRVSANVPCDATKVTLAISERILAIRAA